MAQKSQKVARPLSCREVSLTRKNRFQGVGVGQVRLYSYILTKVWIYEEYSGVINILNLVFDILGKNSFNRRSLHHIGSGLNPYEQAISIIGKSLAAFDKDNLIPYFGFGDGISLNK